MGVNPHAPLNMKVIDVLGRPLGLGEPVLGVLVDRGRHELLVGLEELSGSAVDGHDPLVETRHAFERGECVRNVDQLKVYVPR